MAEVLEMYEKWVRPSEVLKGVVAECERGEVEDCIVITKSKGKVYSVWSSTTETMQKVGMCAYAGGVFQRELEKTE